MIGYSPPFSFYNILTLIGKVNSNRLPLYVLVHNRVVPRFKQGAIIGFHSHVFWRPSQFSLPLSMRSEPSLVYIKLMFPFSKQFSADSFIIAKVIIGF